MPHREVTTTKKARLIGSLVIGTLSLAATAVSAGASTAIGPNQAFIGLVNGKHPTATITVACPGPVRPPPFGQTGHPLANQTLGVMRAPSTTANSGFTGSRGTSIITLFVVPVDTPAVPVTFTHYGTQPLPTSLLLPCSGSSPVVFSPKPTSKTARSASVMVTYENIAVTPTPTASRAVISDRTITVTQADNGRTYRLHKGDGLDVQLTGPSDFIWTEPASSNQTVLQRTGGSSGAPATGTFVARSPGKAQVTARATPNCSGACPTLILAFEVNVTVVR